MTWFQWFCLSIAGFEAEVWSFAAHIHTRSQINMFFGGFLHFSFSYFELYCLFFGFMLLFSGDLRWEVDVFVLIVLWETGVELLINGDVFSFCTHIRWPVYLSYWHYIVPSGSLYGQLFWIQHALMTDLSILVWNCDRLNTPHKRT